jgi:hypothetical protein
VTSSTRMTVALLILAGGLLGGCGASPSTPSLMPLAGTVELSSNHPDGATLVVNPCLEEGDWFPCSRDLQMTFSVVLNRDISRAIVSTQFYTAAGHLCATANTQTASLSAGTPLTLTAAAVYVRLPGTSTSPEMCALPMQTTRIVAHLIQNGGPAVGDLLTQEFTKAYTFVNP